jgi:hypothetical protein
MLTLTHSMFIEGYTVFHDDENEIDAMQDRIDRVLSNEQRRANSILDDLRGRKGNLTSTFDEANLDPNVTSQVPSKPPAPPANKVLKARRFYVLPDNPAIAMDHEGKPIFSMIVYRIPEDRLDPTKPTADVGGGILTFTTELTVPQPKMDAITKKLKAIVNGDSDHPVDVEVGLVQFTEGKVSIAVAGEATAGSTNTFVKDAVGTGSIVGVANNRKAVMVNLTQNGAALMAQAIEKLRTLPINVSYEMGYEHRLLGVTMRVWCDVNSSYQLIQTTYHEEHSEDSGYLGLSEDNVKTDKITAATEVMVRNKVCGVEVIPYSSAVDQDTITALTKFGQDMLQKELEKVVEAHPVPDTIDRTWVEKWGSDASNTLNFQMDQRMVLVQKYTPSANIQSVFQRGDADKLIAYFDLGLAFFRLLRVPVRVNADFSKLPISHVVVTISYKSKLPDGTAQTDVTKSFDFTDGGQLEYFECYANSLDTVSYDWKAEVHYRNTGGVTNDTFVVSKSKVKDRFLIVDVGTIGMISVSFAAGLVDFEKYPRATVSVRYTSKNGKTFSDQFPITKDEPEHVWSAIIREEWSGTYDYKVDWQSKADSRTITGEWQNSDKLTVALDGPIKDHLDVAVVCSGNFKEGLGGDPISHVIVGLVYGDGPHQRTGSLDFTDEKQLQHWIVDLEDPNLRDYRYRYTVVYKDGLVQEFPTERTKYLPGQPGYIVVGPEYDLTVQVSPLLLARQGFPDWSTVVEVDLTYKSNDGKINTTSSFTFSKESSGVQVWRVSTGGRGPQPYTVDVTYYALTGKENQVPTIQKDGTVFIVPPMAQPT